MDDKLLFTLAMVAHVGKFVVVAVVVIGLLWWLL
jgi:hypothetical protein